MVDCSRGRWWKGPVNTPSMTPPSTVPPPLPVIPLSQSSSSRDIETEAGESNVTQRVLPPPVMTSLPRISPLNQISEVKSYLYLSGIAVIKADPIKNLGITTIVNATTEESTPHVRGVEVVRIRVEDHPSANLSLHFHSIADKIKSVKDAEKPNIVNKKRGEGKGTMSRRVDGGGRVLVHCMAGVSRSVSLVLAFLVKYERMTLRQAYFYVRSVRSIIHPNLGFWKQLVDFERRLRGFPSVTLVATRLSPLPIPDVYSEELREAEKKEEREERAARQPKPSPPPFSSLSLNRASASRLPSKYLTRLPSSSLSSPSTRPSSLPRSALFPVSRFTPSLPSITSSTRYLSP